MINPVITALGLVLGVLIAYLQIQKNQRAALELQENHLRNELKLKVYQRVSSIIVDSADKLSKVETEYLSVVSSLGLHARKGISIAPNVTGSELADRAHEAQYAFTRVLYVLEEYEIIFGRFGAFRRELSAHHAQFLQLHSDLWGKVLLFLPFIHTESNQRMGAVIFPSVNEVSGIESIYEDFRTLCNDLSGHLIDLQIETQNELLGDLIKRRLPPRHPASPSVIVLGRDDDDLVERPRGRLI